VYSPSASVCRPRCLTHHRLSSSAASCTRVAAGVAKETQRAPPRAAPPCAPRAAAGRASWKAARVRVGPTSPATVQVTVDLACSARELRWLWALRGALEGVLVGQASLTATAFLDFCRARCAEHAAQRDCLHEARIHLHHVALPMITVQAGSKTRVHSAFCLHAQDCEDAGDGAWLHGSGVGPALLAAVRACSCSRSAAALGLPPVIEQRQAHRTACMHMQGPDTDMSSGGLHIPLPHLHKVGGPWPADMIGLIGSHGHVLGRPAQRAAAPAQGRHHLPCRQGRFLGFGSRHAHLPAQRCYCSVSFVMTQFILDQSCVHISRRSAAGAQQATGVLSALHIPLTSAGNRRTRPLG